MSYGAIRTESPSDDEEGIIDEDDILNDIKQNSKPKELKRLVKDNTAAATEGIQVKHNNSSPTSPITEPPEYFNKHTNNDNEDQLWWKNGKVWLFLIVIVVVILAAVIIAVIVALHETIGFK